MEGAVGEVIAIGHGSRVAVFEDGHNAGDVIENFAVAGTVVIDAVMGGVMPWHGVGEADAFVFRSGGE